VWADTLRPAAERRQRLFALWDDCATDAIGRRARSAVVRFVRTHLPAESPDAFTTAELAAFNARRTSSEPFAPYG
jgi:hypothetical protein